MQTRLRRAEVPTSETWDLSDLYPSASDWEADLTAVEEAIPGATAFQGRLGDGAAALLACLETQEALLVKLTRAYTYASLRGSEDGTCPINQGDMARASALAAKVSAALSYIRSEILQLPDGTVERYLQEEPGLASFRVSLDQLLELKPHTLAPEAEKALAALGEVLGAPYTIYSRAKSSDMRFEPFVDAQGRQIENSFAVYEGQFEGEADAVTRRAAFASFVDGLKNYQNTFAATFATEVKKNVVLARLRGYESATHMLLHGQRVPMNAYENVLNIIQAELAPHMRRLANLRKRVLGLEKLYYCDIRAPLDPEFKAEITYEEATDLLLESLATLGPEYSAIMERGMRERWVDRVDNIGKSTGAFCSSPYGVHSYILITWTGTMRSAFTMAHELGHAGHFMLAMKNQRYMNTRPSMFFVEAPSTMNELILGAHILERSDNPRMRRWVIMQFLGTFHHNFVTHLLEAELQRRIYALAEAGRPITANLLSQTKGEILAGFWGDTLEVDDGARLTWMRQPHYYMGLYPYTYAAGLSAAVAAHQAIQTEGQPAIDRWLQVLRAGGTAGPLELMQMAGVDMTQPDPIRQAVAFVGRLVDQLEESFA